MSKRAVLIVDDDASARETLDALLGDEFDVETVPSAAHAEAKLARRSFDVVITDYQMPGISGLQLLQKIEALYPNLVGIIVTGHGGYPEIERARSNWRDFRVLIKPYAPDDLVRAVRNAAGIAALRKATSRLPTR